nr:reverse transcriptase domain-containing protein [Tanacetum cinerariifolium]
MSILLPKDAFRLEKTRETYQRLVDKISNDQIGRHLEAYISTSEESLLKDIQKAFDRLWSINIKLNLKKCSFDVEEGTQELYKQEDHMVDSGCRGSFLKNKGIHGNLTNTYSPNHRPEKSRRIAQWAIELGEHDIEFKGRNSVKRHIQADFLIKTPPAEENKIEIRKLGTAKEEAKLENMWKLYTDGASISDGSGIGLMQVSLEGKEYRML